MSPKKFFVGKSIGFLVVLVLVGVGYVAMNPEVLQNLIGKTKPADEKISIVWRLTDAGESNDMPHTKVEAVINGTAYDTGTFVGSCSEIGANGGVDGKGLLAGELSAVQCWYAGGGDEIGVFAHEDGGVDILVGGLSEQEEGGGLFRGDFKARYTIPF